MTVNTFLKRFDAGKEFETDELNRLACIMPKGFQLIESIEGPLDGRWTYPLDIYFKAGDRYFYMLQHIGLTEYQEDETYCDQPVEVNPPVEKTKLIHYNELTIQ